jgi:hypothetical protein
MALARYTYLPWLRRGAANAIGAPAASSSRASVEVSLAVSDGTAVGAPIRKTFRLTGPGDIIGINRDLIVRTEPRAWVTDFEPNHLAFVDFYDEDFPWRHTPAPPAGERLIPWLTLLVLAEGEFEIDRSPGKPLNSVRIKAPDPRAFFAPDDELWAWAHVQILGDVGGTATVPDAQGLTNKLAGSPDSGVSRLISPRRLAASTAYTAFLIPTFEVGRKGGLGKPIDDAVESGVKLAWSDGAAEFPIYYEWYFRTGEVGDFEDLVERMVPRPVDKRVGVRDIDIASPGFGMPVVAVPVGPDHHEGVVGLEGALKAPTMEPKPLDARSGFPEEAAPIVNAPAAAQSAGDVDPVVSPPLYGGWHVLVDRVDLDAMGGWVNELGLDPRERAAAGLGARVIRTRQEDYMKLAWEQVGEVLAANRRAAFFRFAQRAAEKSFDKNIAVLPTERFLTVTAPMFSRVLGSPHTIRALLGSSRLPVAGLSPAFRKLTRPRGLLVRRALPEELRAAATGKLASAINDGSASAAPKSPPVKGPMFGQVADDVGGGQGGGQVLLRWGWLLILLLVLLALIALANLGIVAGLAVAIALGAAAFGIRRAMQRARDEATSVANLHLEDVTPASVPDTPPAGFGLSSPGDTNPPAATAAVAAQFGRALTQFTAFLAATPPAVAPRYAFDARNAHAKVQAAITPSIAFPRRAGAAIRIGDRSIIDYARDAYPSPPIDTQSPRITPVLAYPDFKDPMYRPLSELSNDLLVPNLGLVPPNTISLMLTNPPFIEAYMAGLNHEFARELLWREYPTDCRGSPFRQFWDVGSIPTPDLTAVERAKQLKDILPLNEWDTSQGLGTHGNRGGVAGHVVLVVRGDLLKRYPNTIIYAQDAVWSTDPQHADELALYDEDGTKVLANVTDPAIHYPLFIAPVAPDLTFIGFNATLETVRGDVALDETAEARATIPASRLGWFFVLQEVVGETRFGLDEEAPKPGMESAVQWDNLSWADLAIPPTSKVIHLAAPFAHVPAGTNPDNLKWKPADGANAADIAAILRQKPVLVGVHGRQMLERGKVD